MASINEILGKNIDSIKALKAEIKSLQDSLIGLDAESQEFKDTSYKLAAAQDELTKVTKAGRDENVAAKDSIVGMQQEYKKLYDTYKMLTDEQRNSDFGKNMAESLDALSTKLNETKQGVGNFKDNIGRYAGDITNAFNGMGVSVGALQGPLKVATSGAKGFNVALKSLAANPIVLIITALVAILVKAAEAIKKNEELSNRLKQAFSAFKPIVDAISNAFDFLAGLLVKVAEGIAKVGEKVLSIIPGFKKAAESHKELAKATNELTKATREANVENSKKQAEIERLREEASATDDVIEKKRLLEEAKELQRQVDEQNIALAQEELRILQEYGEKTANSAEENEKLAAAQKKVNDAIAQGERNMRQYNKQLDAVTNKTNTATSAGKNWREEAKKLYQQTIEDNKDEITKLTEKYEKEKKLLKKYGYDTTLLTKKYNSERLEIVIKEAKKEKETIAAYLDGQIDNINRSYTNLKSIFSRETEKLFIEGKKLEAFKMFIAQQEANLKAIIENAQGDMKTMWDYILNNADLRKLDDFDYMKEFLSVFTTEFKQEDIKKIIDGFNTIAAQVGEEGWMAFTSGITNTIKNLNDAGIDIKNLPDFKARMADLGNDAAEQFGNSFIASAKELVEKDNVEMFKRVFSFDPSMISFEEIENFIRGEEWSILMHQKEFYEQNLADFSGTTDQKLEMMEAYYNVLSELRARDIAAEELYMQRKVEIWDAHFDHFDALTSSISSVIDVINTEIQAEIDSGKITQKEAEKKKNALKELQKVQLGVAIAGIAANTAAGIVDVWRGYAAELPVNAETAAATGPAAAATKAALDAKSLGTAIIRTATLAVEGSAQIAAAIGGYISKSRASSSEGGSDTGVAAVPMLIDSTPYSYTRTVQTEEDEDYLNNLNLWVSVTDIESGLGQRVKVTDESSF